MMPRRLVELAFISCNRDSVQSIYSVVNFITKFLQLNLKFCRSSLVAKELRVGIEETSR